MNKLQFHDKIILRRTILPRKINFSDEELLNYLNKPEILESIYIATPILYKKIVKLINNEILDLSEMKRIKNSARKYMLRMSNRPTPFGLFSGISVIRWDKEDKIQFAKKIDIIKTTSINFRITNEIIHYLQNVEVIRKQLKYKVNSTIYKFGKNYRYTEYLDNTILFPHQLSSVNKDVILFKLVHWLKSQH